MFFVLAEWTPVYERQWKAALRVALVSLPFLLGWPLALVSLPHLLPWLSGGMAVALFAFCLALFFPWRDPQGIRIVGEGERVDERDVIFSRMGLQPGTPQYAEYYSRRPELEEVDARLRSMPELGTPGGRFFDPLATPLATACFDVLREAGKLTEEISSLGPKQETPDLAHLVKGMARYLGAKLVGIAELDLVFVYSHRGRRPEHYGEPVQLPHRYAIVIGVEMDSRMVNRAPAAPTLMESAREYVEAAKVALILARYLRLLGFSAQAHIDANYRVMVVPLAWKAGLGELGRFNYLITPQLGPRVRWSAVTTDAPLTPDEPVAFGVQDLCRVCLKCAENCPVQAISAGEKTVIRGVERWDFSPERCFAQWKSFGTDCGLCMRVCPLSRPLVGLYRLLRWAMARSPFARRLLVWWDNLIYGRRVPPPASRPSLPPPWWG